MTTNRDLDIRMAKAMGWDDVQAPDPMHPHPLGWPPEGSAFKEIVPAFTTDMTAAMTVVEKLEAREGFFGWWMAKTLDDNKRGAPVRVLFQWIVGRERKLIKQRGEGATLSEAIVDAALQILEAGE